MGDLIGRAGRQALGERGAHRQCTATNREGERCGRAPVVGGFVCDRHGGKAPQVVRSARERLLALVDPAMDALLRALHAAPPCEACGRTDADRDPVVLRAAQIVLDRTGHGPHASLTVNHAREPEPYHRWLTPDDMATLSGIVAGAKARMEAGEPEWQGAREQAAIARAAVEEGVLVPEDDDEQGLIPSGKQPIPG